MAKKPENLSFEESLSELEQIVTQLEQGEIDLDKALVQFERGVSLVRNSQTKLAQAQQKVSILLTPETDAVLSPFNTESE